MSDQIFLLPDLGEGLEEAEIGEWKVQVGDAVTIDQVIAEVETAKAMVEVPIPFDGIVLTLHGAVGDTLQVGTPLITVSSTADQVGDAAIASAHEQHRTEERAGASGNVLIGYGTSEATGVRRRRPKKDQPPPVPAPTSASEPASGSAISAAVCAGAAPALVVSPLVRRLAADHGIDPTNVAPADPSRIITRADIERSIAQIGSHEQLVEPVDSDLRIPLKGLRKAVAEKLSTSRREIPDATTWVDVDATALVQARRSINALPTQSDKISLLALLARLTIAALKQFPALNSAVDSERSEIVQFRHIHLGLAAQTPRGLVVPVIDHADALTTNELSQQIGDTIALARDGKLPPQRLSGGTFTLNNYGVFGVDGSTPIINHPEAAILGIGRLIDKPWVIDGSLAIRTVTQISLSFDHRVCDGGTAAGFLRLFGDYIENPIAVLGGV